MRQANVRTILKCAHLFDWSLQGFGMFRMYLGEGTRLHVWDNRFRTERVTDIHTHPWHLRSEIVAGTMINERFTETLPEANTAQPYVRAAIRCGEDAYVYHEESVRLRSLGTECYSPGDTYEQGRDELHRSMFVNGTVTLCHRWDRRRDNPDDARSYYPKGGTWVDAKPRPAKASEVKAMAEEALRWLV